MGGDYKYKIYTTKALASIWFAYLVGLIYRFYSNSCFKVIRSRDAMGMSMIINLICKSGSIMSIHEIDRKRLIECSWGFLY